MEVHSRPRHVALHIWHSSRLKTARKTCTTHGEPSGRDSLGAGPAMRELCITAYLKYLYLLLYPLFIYTCTIKALSP